MAISPTNTNTTATSFIPYTGAPLTPQGAFTLFAINAQDLSVPKSQTALVSQEKSDAMNPLGVPEIALIILSHCDLQTLGRLARVNQFLNACVKDYDEQLDLKRLCPNLRILDAKAQGITINDEPSVSKGWILKNYTELEPRVEDLKGLTLLTMPKGLTLNQLIAIAAKAGITVDCLDETEEQGSIPVEQTYVILITNNIFEESRNKMYMRQRELVARYRCVMPTVQESVALCVFTNKVFQKCLYGQDPWTYGRTSTRVQVCGRPLAVGASVPDRLSVGPDSYLDLRSSGVGGQRKFGH